MADLSISVDEVDLDGEQFVKIELVDKYRNPIPDGFVQETGTFHGTVTVDLTANDADQYYLVTVGPREVVIDKSADAQTLTAARFLSTEVFE